MRVGSGKVEVWFVSLGLLDWTLVSVFYEVKINRIEVEGIQLLVVSLE